MKYSPTRMNADRQRLLDTRVAEMLTLVERGGCAGISPPLQPENFPVHMCIQDLFYIGSHARHACFLSVSAQPEDYLCPADFPDEGPEPHGAVIALAMGPSLHDTWATLGLVLRNYLRGISAHADASVRESYRLQAVFVMQNLRTRLEHDRAEAIANGSFSNPGPDDVRALAEFDPDDEDHDTYMAGPSDDFVLRDKEGRVIPSNAVN